ncbi:hypothetical protein AVEN_208002-1 [Araneus ventricosus]|uniref:Uncharacterized protein n=1 Tax=Araneus ventricosus TaxID=182803 RepID=A0A4Y2Q1B0_ARAVE|nr:hypothetical protein AVEN_208002-1 [Araneus ventricosus]
MVGWVTVRKSANPYRWPTVDGNVGPTVCQRFVLLGRTLLLIVNKDGRFSKHDEEKTQFRANQSKHGNPSGHNDQLDVVKDIPIDAYSGIGFYADVPSVPAQVVAEMHNTMTADDHTPINMIP